MKGVCCGTANGFFLGGEGEHDLRPPGPIGSAGPYIVSRLCALALAAASVASLSCLVSNFSKFLLMPCKNQTYFLFRRHCIRTSFFLVELASFKCENWWSFENSCLVNSRAEVSCFGTTILLEVFVKFGCHLFFWLACQLQVWKLMIFWKFLFSQYDRLKKSWSQLILWPEFCSKFL